MSWTIRPATSDDIPAIVDLVNAVQRPEERTTLEIFRHEEGMRRPDEAFARFVAIGDRGMVAVAQTQNSHTRPRHKFSLYRRPPRQPPGRAGNGAGRSPARVRRGERGQ